MMFNPIPSPTEVAEAARWLQEDDLYNVTKSDILPDGWRVEIDGLATHCVDAGLVRLWRQRMKAQPIEQEWVE